VVPIVLAHARALLTSSAEGRTAYLDADLLVPATILGSDEVMGTLDLTRPVGLSLIAVLHFLPDDIDPYDLVAKLLDALAPGSYLTATTATADFAREQADQAAEIYRTRGIPAQSRSRARSGSSSTAWTWSPRGRRGASLASRRGQATSPKAPPAVSLGSSYDPHPTAQPATSAARTCPPRPARKSRSTGTVLVMNRTLPAAGTGRRRRRLPRRPSETTLARTGPTRGRARLRVWLADAVARTANKVSAVLTSDGEEFSSTSTTWRSRA
jgi:hypothetical protein